MTLFDFSSLLGNRLTGSIPKELGNISTLTSLVLEVNQFSGSLPLELGNLKNLERLLLNSNNFSGQLPWTLGKLTALKDFRIADNNFTGKIPDFIQNWPSLVRLVIQASGLEGPIPLSISDLRNLTDLRISDLNGAEETFPLLSSIPNFEVLILRSCNITGELPVYLRDMTKLKTLDLSFNKLNGSIPSDYSSLSEVDYIYLTGNLLTGPVPDWMVNKGDHIDLSYNNFTSSSSVAVADCQLENVNLFKGLAGNKTGVASCLGSFQCQRNWPDFHINCGGKEVFINNIKFEEDTVNAAASKFFQSKSNWALSSTGHFMDDNRNMDTYLAENISTKLPDLYMNARISPLSLTYYGFCLVNGNYTVELHFAEIVFSSGNSFRSLGRRIFDVYIQENSVLKDFNIEDAAGGVGKKIIINFTAVVVADNTLEIRFQWTGRGTTSIPDRGVYGPLVSAVSVNPEFKPPSDGGSSVSAGAVIGIVAAVLLAIFLVQGILWWKNCLNCRDKRDFVRRL